MARLPTMTIVTTPLGTAAFVFSHLLRRCGVPLLASNSQFHRQRISRNRFTTRIVGYDDIETNMDISPALVDVDCNLLHKDLVSVMKSISLLKVDYEIQEELKILHHPSSAMSNIVAMISPSSTIEESVRSFHLLESSTDQQKNYICVKTTAGVHPYNSLSEGTAGSDNLSKIRALLDKPNSNQYISCIGETGLDYSEGFPEKSYQIAWFMAQLDLAFEYNLPVFLHERLAFADTLQCIDEVTRNHPGKSMPKIIVHCFTGSCDECAEYMKRGYFTSISGYVTKPGGGSDELKKCLRDGIVPLDRLMIESDSPYMGFVGNKNSFFDAEGEHFLGLPNKKRKRLTSIYPNVPSSLPLVLRAVHDQLNSGREQRSEVKISLQELAQFTTNNAINFFGLKIMKNPNELIH